MKGKRLLLIDDDENFNRVLEHQLGTEGFEVASFTSSEEGMKEFENGDYEIVVSDIQMPGLSGMDVLKRVKRKSEDAVVI